MIGFLIFGAGFVFCVVKGRKQAMAIKRYEFENRTSGGVVEFKDFDAAQKFNRKKSMLGLWIIPMTICALGAVFSLAMK